MKTKTLALLGALAGIAMAVAPATSHAQSRVAYTLTDTTLHSGPHYSYPEVSYVPDRQTVQVYGCLRDWSWCDVRWRGERGWIDADYLTTNYYGSNYYGDRYSIWYSSGNGLGLPIVSFLLNSYWNDHYRHHNWYRNHNYWHQYRPPVYHRDRDRNRWNNRDRDHDRRDWDRNRDGRPDWNRDRDGRPDWNRNDNRNDRGDWNRNRDRNDNRGRNDGDNRDWNRNGRPDNQERRDNRQRVISSPQPARVALPVVRPRTEQPQVRRPDVPSPDGRRMNPRPPMAQPRPAQVQRPVVAQPRPAAQPSQGRTQQEGRRGGEREGRRERQVEP